MGRVYYKEEQHFNQWWIWLILIAVSGLWLWQLVQQIIMGIPFGTNPAPDLVVILMGIFPVAIIFLFRWMVLETIIDETGIHYRFRPFQRKPRSIKPDEIDKYEVKKYNPIKDYGGWGIRYGLKGKAYNVRGNRGVLFEMKNGKKFLLGTQDPENIRSAMNKLMNREQTDR